MQQQKVRIEVLHQGTNPTVFVCLGGEREWAILILLPNSPPPNFD